MLAEQLNQIQEYFKINKMNTTLAMFRKQLASKIPHKPSSQLIHLIDTQIQQEQKPHISIKSSKNKKKTQLLADGLLGKIAYSSKILQNPAINEKISKLLDNKIFQKSVNTLFPQTNTIIKQIKKDQSQYSYDFIGSRLDQLDGPSSIQPYPGDISIVSQPRMILDQLLHTQQDQYIDNNDPGYIQKIYTKKQLFAGCSRLRQQYGYPQFAVYKSSKPQNKNQKPKKKFSSKIIFPSGEDDIYPLQYNSVIYDSYNIKWIYDRQKTGLEPQKQLQLHVGSMLMGRFKIQAILGNGVFARVVKARDMLSPNKQLTCLKIVARNKDFFDQSMDEIKFLRLIKANCDPDTHNLLRFKQAYYYRQHLLLQTDLMLDDLLHALLTYSFSISIIKIIARQILTAVATLHSLNIIHSDLKPQNILVKSYEPIQIKVVDLGNSCFKHDNLGVYVQSRSYRAPQVLLQAGYDQKIDIWSVGCIIAQLWTKVQLFKNTQHAGMLAKMQSICGKWPQWMLESGNKVSQYFSKQNLIYFQSAQDQQQMFHILIPKKTTLKNRIKSDDSQFIAFLQYLLQLDPYKRPSAEEALQHPFLQ